MAKKHESPEIAPRGVEVGAVLEKIRADRIRAAHARIPTPSYQQIALEACCSVKTVYNVIKGVTHGAN